MDSRTFNILSICTGYGGLDLGVRLAVPDSRTVCAVEIEAYVCAQLVTRMSEGFMDSSPVWTDARTFDGRPWRGRVHILVAGYPCQPFSVAGKQLGAEDPRHLWPHIARIIREVRPPFVFLENVANHLRLGFREVRDELRGMGYRVEAGLFTAAEAGAPHLRKRLFILAYSESVGRAQRTDFAGAEGPLERARPGTVRGVGNGHPAAGVQDRGGIDAAGAQGVRLRADVADSVCAGRQQIARGAHGDEGADEGRAEAEAYQLAGGRADVADAERGRRHDDSGAEGEQDSHEPKDGVSVAHGAHVDDAEGDNGRGEQQSCRAGCGRAGLAGASADVGDSPDGWLRRGEAQRAGGLAAQSVEAVGIAIKQGLEIRAGRCGDCASFEGWNYGTALGAMPFPPSPSDIISWQRILDADPSLEPAVRGVVDGRTSRVDELRALGNGVVPVVAAYAFCTLAEMFD